MLKVSVQLTDIYRFDIFGQKLSSSEMCADGILRETNNRSYVFEVCSHDKYEQTF